MKLKFMGTPSRDEVKRYKDAVYFDVDRMMEKQVVLDEATNPDGSGYIKLWHKDHRDDPHPIVEITYENYLDMGFAYAAMHAELMTLIYCEERRFSSELRIE